jgi:hypothetical protein
MGCRLRTPAGRSTFFSFFILLADLTEKKLHAGFLNSEAHTVKGQHIKFEVGIFKMKNYHIV